MEPPIKFRAPGTCKHSQREVDAELPLVTCSECGATLDPYWCLRDLVAYDAYLDERFTAVEAARADVNRLINQCNSRIRGVVGAG